MRLAVISDVHGNVLALEAALADIAARSPDATVNLGDCVTSPLWPRETFERLQSLGMPTVRGNHDRLLETQDENKLSPAGRYAHGVLDAAHRQSLSTLPSRIELTDEILAVHGTPQDDSTYLLEENVDGRLVPASRAVVRQRLGEAIDRAVVLCGHSHNQGFRLVEGRCLVLNPGSVGCPVMADHPTAPQLEYCSPHARYALLTKRRGQWSAELIAVEYDWDSAARRALDNGRRDWAEAMSTGAVTASQA